MLSLGFCIDLARFQAFCDVRLTAHSAGEFPRLTALHIPPPTSYAYSVQEGTVGPAVAGALSNQDK
jgi:hypothetical protein